MKLGLAFSGGKDSWACLWLNRERLGEITVLWVDTGKNFPELLKTVEMAKEMCPNFVRVPVDRDAQNSSWGLPSDVVPVQWTVAGQRFTGRKPVTIQPYLSCCYDNISSPLHRAALDHGITHLIRGQRSDEAHTSPSRDGTIVEGITYLHPIENWSRDDVMEFLSRHMEIPAHFSLNHSSMDCYDCTGYRSESRDRIAFMRKHHPDLYAKFFVRNAQVNAALREALDTESCHG